MGPDFRRGGRTCLDDALNREQGGQFFWYRHVLQPDVVGQAVLERWVRLADDEWRQIAASRLGDAEAVGADKLRGHQLFLIGYLRQRRSDDVPTIGFIAESADRRHYRILAGERELHRGATDGVGVLEIGR